MGCDIHAYKEKCIDGKWVTADEWVPYKDFGDGEKGQEVPFEKRFHRRNYNLFGLLAGVRNREGTLTLTPRGMPWDVSPEVRAENERWNSDGHSHSYLYLHELRSLRAIDFRVEMPMAYMVGKDLDEIISGFDGVAGENHRLVFWFDN